MLTISPTSLLTYYQPIRTLSRHGSLTDFPLCHTHTRTHSAEFRAYEQTLFSPKSKETERLQLTSDENAALDEQITSFLRLLSPFFLLKPAHKALEYLIRKYRINV